VKFYNKKVVKSGNIIEVYEYQDTQIKREVRRVEGERLSEGSNEFSEEEKEETNIKNGNRRRRTLRRLINANDDILTKFFTLTFKENLKSVDKAYYELKKFKKRLKYYLNKHYDRSLKYVVVVEFQKRGAVHFHMLCNLPYIKADKLAALWNNGFIKINKIETVDNVGSYVVKYMGKDFNNEKMKGRKRYNRSRNLKEPEEILDKKKVAEMVAQLPDEKMVFEKTFNNESIGDIHYKQFNLNR